MTNAITLRPYQDRAVRDTQGFLKYRGGRGIAVLPCAAGKSIIIAKIAEWVASYGERVLIIAHRAKLLEQNQAKINGDVGVVSAGLDKREFSKSIIVGGIQTIYNKKEQLGDFKIIIVDECDNISNDPKDETMYWKLLNSYPDTRVLGFTATPFRTKEGALTWGNIYHETSYLELLNDGYICPLVNKVCNDIDLNSVSIKMGEYVIKQLEDIMMDEKIFKGMMSRVVKYGKDRKSWLIFCTTVEHAKTVCFALSASGIKAAVVSGDMSEDEKSKTVKGFEDGKYQALLTVYVLTVGTDIPCIDMLVDLAPTKSRRLHEQKYGRGIRLSEGKKNCLLLDFAGNLMEHGALGSPVWKYEKGQKVHVSRNASKVCPSCEEMTPIASTKCVECDYEFEIDKRSIIHNSENDTESKTISDGSEVKESWYTVTSCEQSDYTSKKGNRMLKVTYHCGVYARFSEYLMLNEPKNKWAYFNKARPWLKSSFPSEWSEIENQSDIITAVLARDPIPPSKIRVRTGIKYPEVMDRSYA